MGLTETTEGVLHLDLAHIDLRYYWEIKVERKHLWLYLKKRGRLGKRNAYRSCQQAMIDHPGRITAAVCERLNAESAALWSAEAATVPHMVGQLQDLVGDEVVVVRG